MSLATFSTEIDKAYDALRGIDSTIKSLTGRGAPPPPLGNDRGVGFRGRGRGGNIGSRLGPAPIFTAAIRSSISGRSMRDGDDDLRPKISQLGRRRNFASMDNDMPEKRTRRSYGGGGGGGDMFDDDDDIPNNGPRPSMQSSVVMPAIESKSRDAAISELKVTEKSEQVVRNRRMFANLVVGTLQQFRKDEKKVLPIEKVQMQKQKEIENRLEEKKKEERSKAFKERGELMDQRREKEREIRRLQRKKAIVQYAEQKQEHFRKLQNFIQTQAKPPIFYLPAKHTLRTLELLKNTAKRVEELIVQRQQQLEKDLSAVDTAPMRDRRQLDRGGGGGFEDESRMRSSVLTANIKSAAEKERDSGRRRRHSGNDVESDGDSDLDASDDDIKKEDDVDVPEAATTAVATNGDEKTTTADEITPTNGEN